MLRRYPQIGQFIIWRYTAQNAATALQALVQQVLLGKAAYC